MQSLAGMFHGRRIPFAVESPVSDRGPVLTVLACPYPDLAEQDRTVCEVEQEVFAEVLGQDLRLDRCRLDGGQCCQFAAAAVGVQPVVVEGVSYAQTRDEPGALSHYSSSHCLQASSIPFCSSGRSRHNQANGAGMVVSAASALSRLRPWVVSGRA